MDLAQGNPLGAPADYAMFQRPDAGDDQLFVVFYMGVVHDAAASDEQGRAIFRDVEFVKIIVPGDRNNIIDRPVEKRDTVRFQKQYAAFKAGLSEEEQVTGTRLTDWSVVTRGQCEELRYLGIRTVEQVAEVRDDVCARVPGLVGLKSKARIWLDKSKVTAEATRLDKVIGGLQNENDTQKKALADQAKRIEALTAALQAQGMKV